MRWKLAFSLFMGLALHQGALADQIRVLTYNVWALDPPVINQIDPEKAKQIGSKDTEIRLDLICKELNNWDVIFIQEAWNTGYRDRLKKCSIEAGLPHVLDLDEKQTLDAKLLQVYGVDSSKILSGIFKNTELENLLNNGIRTSLKSIDVPIDSGLMILSRYPLVNSDRLIFKKNGRSDLADKDGEKLARKSVITATMQHPVLGEIQLANTHLVSAYPGETYKPGHRYKTYGKQRVAQFQELAEFITSKIRNEGGIKPLIIGGDFNSDFMGQNQSYEKRFMDVFNSYFSNFTDLGKVAVQCTSCPDNSWNSQNHDAGIGWVDIIYATRHFEVMSGGITLHDKTYASPTTGAQANYSDHYGYELIFDMTPPREKPNFDQGQQTASDDKNTQNPEPDNEKRTFKKDLEDLNKHLKDTVLPEVKEGVDNFAQHVKNNLVPEIEDKAKKASDHLEKNVLPEVKNYFSGF